MMIDVIGVRPLGRGRQDGALSWPNGYDWDPMALHDEMKEADLLRRADAAE